MIADFAALGLSHPAIRHSESEKLLRKTPLGTSSRYAAIFKISPEQAVAFLS